jgi:hypothetical protein
MAFSRKIYFTLCTLFVSSHLQAAIISQSSRVSGGSNQILISDNQWRVYGSFLGPDSPTNTTDTYNSCEEVLTADINFVGCNEKRVMGSTILNITFSDDVQYTGTKNVVAYIKPTGSTGTITNSVNLNTNTTPYSQNASYLAQIPWSTLCTAAGGVIGDYNAASTAMGLSGRAETCLATAGGAPLNKSVQLAVGVNSGSGVASTELLIDLRFFTPETTLGLFSPSLGPAVEGSDGFRNVTPCEKNVTALSTGTESSSGSAQGNYSGFCDYQLIPGDEKVRIETDQTRTNSLDIYSNDMTVSAGELTSIPFVGFVLYLSNTNFTNTFPWNAPKFVTNSFNTPGNVDSGFQNSSITSSLIKNEVPVFTRMASKDQAGNITHLFSDAVIGANCAAIPADDTDPNYYRFFVGQVITGDSPPFAGRCPYASVPSLVTGLLTEDVNCFVATALTGSPYNYQVLALREFRNRFLKSFSLGQSFIDLYYEHGPVAAKWLNQNPEFKPFFRILLWPTYLVAKVFNLFGAFIGLVFLFLIFAVPLVTLNLRRKTFIKF